MSELIARIVGIVGLVYLAQLVVIAYYGLPLRLIFRPKLIKAVRLARLRNRLFMEALRCITECARPPCGCRELWRRFESVESELEEVLRT